MTRPNDIAIKLKKADPGLRRYVTKLEDDLRVLEKDIRKLNRGIRTFRTKNRLRQDDILALKKELKAQPKPTININMMEYGGVVTYLTTMPQFVEEGCVLVHSHINHTARTLPGENGFRAWTQATLEACDCGWAGLAHSVVARKDGA